jgi:transaldolase
MEVVMNGIRRMHDLGQRIWLDNITRDILDNGTLQRYISEMPVTGLTSNPTIFHNAIKASAIYDPAIEKEFEAGQTAEEIFMSLAVADIRRAADLFLPVHHASHGLDGWVSLEVSPLLADDIDKTVETALQLHDEVNRPNLMVKVPGTPAGLAAMEEIILAGVPVNITLLFSSGHYLAAAEAYMHGLERRLKAGLDAEVTSVASLFVSRWDVAVKDSLPQALHNRLGIAVAMRAYRAYRELLNSSRWQALQEAGARPQRLLWASTGTKDPAAAATLYADALIAPGTINTLPDKTLQASAASDGIFTLMPADGGNAESVIAAIVAAGIDVDALAARLQAEGVAAFTKSWLDLLALIAGKTRQMQQVHAS